MFVERLLNQGNAPLLERVLNFTATRQRLLMENVTNIDTPGYRQKDLSVKKFQAMLRDRAAAKATNPPGTTTFKDIDAEIEEPRSTLLFHDGNNRSIEQLMTENAKNALMHNLVVELLRKQYGALESALKERVG
jgi:flagellar basal-body rod protein FlgB